MKDLQIPIGLAAMFALILAIINSLHCTVMDQRIDSLKHTEVERFDVLHSVKTQAYDDVPKESSLTP